MSTDPSTPENDANLSGLGRALMGTNEGSKPSGPWVPPTAEELHAILPQYEIVKMLGRGGMGAVYMGRQTALDRPVAIKILSAQLEESDMGFTERFKNEAKAMAKLNHPGIVAVYDFGEAPGGLLYIVMEYVDGTDVAKMIAKSGRLHTEHAMAITAHVCDALAYAHERGIIHRDIKPANIMVDYDGSVKIADFGLAKVNAGGQTLGLTQSGMAMGTLHFMAPEALMLGSSVDHRADIYAVGVMLYQMLTGKLPQGMFKMPSLLVAGLDPRYDGIIAKGIMEDREARYQSAREMRSDLDGIMTQPVVKADPEAAQIPQAVLPTQARPQRPGGKPVMRQSAAPGMSEPAPRSSQSWLWMSALGLLALGGAAWWMIQPRGQTMPPAAAEGADSAKSAHEAQTIAASATTTNPAEATKERPFVNSVGMKFVPVPGTNVLFCIHETRYRDYAVYASGRANIDGSWQDQVTDGIAIKERGDDHPVTQVNWNDAQAFCVWLSNKESKSYRLPTDEEWSHAVGVGNKETRGANITPYSLSRKVPDEYPWGSQWPLLGKSGNYADQSLIAQGLSAKGLHLDGYDDGFPTTSPVMSFPPNSYGLYDLGGNVWEWCEDWHNDSKIDRVIRGASWLWGESGFLLSSHRGHIGQGNRFQDRGFRVVLATESAGPSASAAIQPSATQEPQSGWTSLFNGKDLTGWRVIGSPQGFTVDQGSIKTGGVRADLIYMGTGAAPASFRDFELRMKVKTGSQGNSGLWFHLPPGIQSTKDCDQSLQVQIDNGFDKQRTGSVVHVVSLSQSPVKDGEWFELRVLVQDKTVTALVNGQQVNQWTQPENWNPPAKAALARMGTGTIGLESWKGNVWFKDIQLRALEDSKPSAGPDEKLILGRWIRTNMDRSGDAYLMDLSPDGSALWTGDNTTVRGTWQFKADVLEVDWNSRFKFLITPPTSASAATLKGTANWPDGATTDIVYVKKTEAKESAASTQIPYHVANQNSPDHMPASERTEIWSSLFNGEDLTGWRPLPASLPVSVSQGMILIRGAADRKEAGALFYVGDGDSRDAVPQFKNFEVMVHLKISKKGNSDLVIHASPIARTEGKAIGGVGSAGVFVQIWNDGDAHIVGGAGDYLYRTGALFMISQQPAQLMNDDEWFTMRVRVEDKRLQVWLKKEGSIDWIQTADWTQPVNWASPRYISQARLGSGTLAFTNWVPAEGEVWIKEVKFRSLEAAAAPPTASSTTWIDTKSRSLQAKFVRVEGGNVILDIAGKVTPVALATLSTASQDIARQLDASMQASVGTGSSSAPDPEAGFISLLNADQPGDWVQVGPGKLDIQNGLATTSSPSKWGVTIYSKRTFADFILKAEFKGVNPKMFNSGLWLRIPDLRNDILHAAENRYEVGIIHPGGDRGRFTGTIWGFQSARVDAVKANDWNELEVTVTGQRYVVKLNGQIVNDFTGNKGLSGYIGLEENIGGPVQFRNVRVKPLP